jgi:ketosteroid isomerase-like protein
MQVSRDWAKAAESRDVERILAYWADDAVVLMPDRAAIVGKDALRAMVQRDMKDPRFTITWEPERASIAQAGDMGYLIEHNRVTFPDGSGKVRTAYGKVVSVWKKDASGNWKCVADISNNNQTQSVLPAE